MKTEGKAIASLIVVLISLLLSLQAPAELAASGVPDPRFGVVEAHQAPSAATSLGAGWTRVTFRWNEIQPNGPQEWQPVVISDEQLANELASGRQVVGLLVTTPGWATDLDVGPGVPRGLHLPADDPNNLWASFVRTIVGRYAGRIDHWIIWNEPDIPDTQHMSWGGSVRDFVQLLQVAYTAAKETNPNSVIHMAAVTHWWDEDWFGQFLQAVKTAPNAATHNYYFDVATLHIYFQPETVYDITVHYRDMMRGHGLHKPIWIAETNAAPSQDPAWPVPNAQFSVSLQQQAAYIVQAFSLGIAAGAERIAVYKMADNETDRLANPEPFGLVRSDGSRRPAFTAYQMATTYMSGFQEGQWERRDTISLVTIDRGDSTTTVAWARTSEPQTAVIPARTTRALMVDSRGGARYIYPERGYYFVDLPGANCVQGCQIGGAPAMLVEGAPAAADTAPTPRSPTPSIETTKQQTAPVSRATSTLAPPTTSPPTEAPTYTPSPTATDTPTVTPSATATPSPTNTASPTIAPTQTPSFTPTPKPSSTPTAMSLASPTPSPTPTLDHAAGRYRSWILIGLLMLGLGALAVATVGGRRG